METPGIDFFGEFCDAGSNPNLNGSKMSFDR